MARHGLYGIFFDNGNWGMSRNKRRAIAFAKAHNCEVRAMNMPSDNRVWDRPTFYASSDRIYDGRKAKG